MSSNVLFFVQSCPEPKVVVSCLTSIYLRLVLVASFPALCTGYKDFFFYHDCDWYIALSERLGDWLDMASFETNSWSMRPSFL